MAKRTSSVANQALLAARAVAQGLVREHFPDMQSVEPHVRTRRCDGAPSPSRGAPTTAPTAPSIGYIFTFSREVRTPEGYTLSRVARVTVDADHHVVKVVTSK